VIHHAPLLAFSAQTTAGFSTTDLARFDDASKLVLILAMGVGGGIGSTAGGIKILRLLIALQLLHTVIMRISRSKHAVVEPRLGGHRLEDRESIDALLIILLFTGVILLSWLPFLVMGYPALNSLFEVVSATGTVGLSTGITSSGLDPLLRGILCLDMLFGRLEVIAWIIFLNFRTWTGRRLKES
jgi:trk system potassium uptake protein TrkH